MKTGENVLKSSMIAPGAGGAQQIVAFAANGASRGATTGSAGVPTNESAAIPVLSSPFAVPVSAPNSMEGSHAPDEPGQVPAPVNLGA